MGVALAYAYVAAGVSRRHSNASCSNPELLDEKSLEIILSPILPAMPRTAALQGDRSDRNKRKISLCAAIAAPYGDA